MFDFYNTHKRKEKEEFVFFFVSFFVERKGEKENEKIFSQPKKKMF